MTEKKTDLSEELEYMVLAIGTLEVIKTSMVGMTMRIRDTEKFLLDNDHVSFTSNCREISEDMKKLGRNLKRVGDEMIDAGESVSDE